jgi:hemoglobin-like flavoprotein
MEATLSALVTLTVHQRLARILRGMLTVPQVTATAVSATQLRRPPPAGIELTAQQKRLLRETFTRLTPASDLVANVFYLRLLELDPSFRWQLKGPAKAQARRFMGVLKLAMLSLDAPERLQPTLNRIDARHHHCGIRASHCLTFSRALIWTFEQSLEARFTREVRQAWAALLAEISRILADWGAPSSVYGRLLRTSSV